jgi:diguanylate cyclase (GGDEF)-like protein/PAS domain S-box-containing protein
VQINSFKNLLKFIVFICLRLSGNTRQAFCIYLPAFFVFTFLLTFSSFTYADIDKPLTAHSNNQYVTTHGGLNWTSDKVFGRNVLIINSYHEGDEKTDLLMRGIYEYFEESGESLRTYTEYMDIKRFSSEFHKENLRQLYKHKYTNRRFDIVIVSGAEALAFILEIRPEIFHSTPIIFASVDEQSLQSIIPLENITGVIESHDVMATIDIALKLHPDINKVIVLSPGKSNAVFNDQFTRKFSHNAQLIIWHELYNSEIEAKLETFGSDVIIIPVSEPRTKAGTIIPYGEFVERISNISNAPVYGLWDTAMGHGAIGGKLISSLAQGQTAAELALKIIDGQVVADVPIVKDSANRYIFDHQKIRAFGIREADLPNNSKIINKPFSIYQNYKTEINSAIVILIIQACIICLLVFVNNRRKKAENKLKTINDKLESRVIQRTNEISLANSQLLKEIEERKLAEKALSISEKKFSKAFHACPDAVTITNLSNDRFIEVNEVFEEYTGYTHDEVIGKSGVYLGLWVNPEDRSMLINRIKTDGTCRNMEVQMRSRFGQIYDVSLSADIIDIAGDECMITITRDITEQKRANTELRRYEKIVSSTKDFISFVDTDYIYRAVNKTFLDAFRLKQEDIIGRHVTSIHGKDSFREIIKPHLDQCLKGITVNLQDEIEMPKTGSRYFDILYSPYFEGENIMGVVITARDMTHTLELSRQLTYQASHDGLTGLINRREFEVRLQRILMSSRKTREQYFLCYMDLDQFKVINDNCGHAAGDELLRHLGKILQDNVRPEDTLARLGGDEFAAIIRYSSLDQAHMIVNHLLKTIENFRFEWQGRPYSVGVSIGMVPITSNSVNLNDLLKQADAACYVAKDTGRNRVHLYQHNDARLERHHFEMQGVIQVQSALDEDRFRLYRQPILPINDITESGEHFEILLRLEKDGEILPPGLFLSSAEQYGLSSKIDSWVIARVFNWLTEYPERQESISLCSINLSGYSLGTDILLDFIIEKLDHLPVIPEKICFEITETATIANYEKASYFIKQLKNRGCHFALDDFGSGFSSFAHLKNLKVDYLKIDGMFIRDMLNDPIAFSMVKSINEIAHIAGIKTIAEFVENEPVLQRLKEIKIDFVQGYVIGMPQPVDEAFAAQLITEYSNLPADNTGFFQALRDNNLKN